MTSTIKVNNIQNQCGANIINESSNTITLGASGDTVALASGASQTGFGRTGTVDWQTSIKTSDFTAANGEGYFVNTTSGAVTMTLPSSPSAGNIVSVKDYAYKFGTNALTVNRNGSNIGGGGDFNPSYDTDGAFLTFIYADSTKGWLLTDEANNTTDASNTFVTATGGTITTSGDYKIHTFTGPGTFCVTAGGGPVANVSYLVIAGGGGGGNSSNGAGRHGGAGGGGGGFRESKGPADCYTASPFATTTGLPVSVGAYPITVGAGGSSGGGGGSAPGPAGSNSIFSTITSAGGGGGAGDEGDSNPSRKNGGSGGGGTSACGAGSAGHTAGDGNSPPVSPAQGQPGITGSPGTAGGGGGGGIGGPSTKAPFTTAGKAGGTSSINASATTRAGGGGGGPNGSAGPGGAGGGGNPGGAGGDNATANTGGGGGGASHNPSSSFNGGAGGSGIVIIRYKFQ